MRAAHEKRVANLWRRFVRLVPLFKHRKGFVAEAESILLRRGPAHGDAAHVDGSNFVVGPAFTILEITIYEGEQVEV